MKTVRLSESQLVELINRVVNENQLVGVQGMSPMPEATATEEPKKEIKPKAEKPVAQKLYDSLAKAKGEFEKDVKAKKLTSMLLDAGIKNKSMDIATNLWMNDDGSIDPERFRIFNPNANEIIMMENDNSIFRNELACLTSV